MLPRNINEIREIQTNKINQVQVTLYITGFTWITGAHLSGTVTGAMKGAIIILAWAALYLTQRPSPRHVTETLPRHTVPMSVTHTVTAFTCIKVKFTHLLSKQ